MQEDAVARVEEYIRQFSKLRDTGGTIHIVHTDPETEGAELTLSDLEEVMDLASRYQDLE